MEQREALKVILEEFPPQNAALVVDAIIKAYKDAYQDSLREQNTEFAKQAFASALPHAINRRINEIIWPKGTKTRVRVALNKTRTNAFLYLDTGRVKLTTAKTNRPTCLPAVRSYRRAVAESQRVELIDPPEYVYTSDQDVIGVLHYGHNFEFGIPQQPEFVRVSRLEQKGRKYGPSLNMIEHARGKMARILEAPVTQPLIAMGQTDPSQVVPQIGQVFRKRGQQPIKPNANDDKEQKTS